MQQQLWGPAPLRMLTRLCYRPCIDLTEQQHDHRPGQLLEREQETDLDDSIRVAHAGAAAAEKGAGPHNGEVEQHGDRHTEHVADVVDDLWSRMTGGGSA